ncbi:hypothetical protein [Parasutterella secunda]|uniref:Uncharacterized protein n=1 Tax=Parasutterella secunda TaxID=626947 RepID=A0ABS2GTL3_9BURK|nr:hypothetical protein [Parasutterella secunda]MBM6928182.1 hypothetical protein [Parasutterella secunda]
MLNNDLLLVPAIKKPYVGEGSWVIQVGTYSGGVIDLCYGVGSGFGSATSYDPRGNYIYGTNGATATVYSSFLLRSIYDDYTNRLEENELSAYFTPTSVATTVYVHRRKGSSIVSEAFNKKANDVTFISSFDHVLFDASDLGKKINIYIGPSSTPPQWL